MRISRALALSLYRTMMELREFELKAYEIFRSGRMPGFIHLYVGEEAVATFRYGRPPGGAKQVKTWRSSAAQGRHSVP